MGPIEVLSKEYNANTESIKYCHKRIMQLEQDLVNQKLLLADLETARKEIDGAMNTLRRENG